MYLEVELKGDDRGRQYESALNVRCMVPSQDVHDKL